MWALFVITVVLFTGLPGLSRAQTTIDSSQLSPDEQLASSDPKIRARGIQTIVTKRITTALPKLEAIAKTDQSTGVRRLACWAIGELRLKAGMLTLRTVARNDPSESVKTAAKRAITKLGGDPSAATPPVAPVPTPTPAPTTPAAKPPQTTPRPTTSPTLTHTPVAIPTPVAGACLKDTDCKGDRVCLDGTCQTLTKHATTGWAAEAAVIGFLGTGAVGGLSVYAAKHPEDLLPAIPLAAGATLVTVIIAPAVKSGSLSVREPNGVSGSLALRVIGWGAFGAHLVGSAALAAAIPFYWLKRDDEGGNWTPQRSWITTNAVLGMVSLTMLSIDTLISLGQAKRLGRLPVEMKSKEHEEEELSMAPYLSPIITEHGTTGASLGLTGRF